MKNTLISLCKLSFLGLALCGVACASETAADSDIFPTAPITQATGSKSFLVSDSSNTSHALVTITSDNAEDLKLDADDFELVAISESEELSADEPERATDVEHEASADAADELEESDSTIIALSEEELGEGVAALELLEKDAPDYRAPFQDRYYYGAVNGTERTASITRDSFWHKVYGSIYYKTSASSSWGTLVSNDKLNHKETLTRSRSTAYQMRIKVRARKTKHYWISFDE